MVITTGHCASEQFDTLQSSSYTDLFDSFSGVLQQSCNLVVTFIANGLPAGLLSSCVISELSKKVVVKNCL